jgi:hypothetical protein
MRALCSTAATFWEPMPGQTTFAGIPLTFYSDLIHYILEVEVAPNLEDHRCATFAPCVVLRKAMQICLPHLSVCKMWREITSKILKQGKYSILKPSEISPTVHWDSRDYGKQWSLRGRYRAYLAIEESRGQWMDTGWMACLHGREFLAKSVFKAYDYGGHDGCHGKVKVVLKVSDDHELFKNEKGVYEWLATAKACASDVPQLYFGDEYPESSYSPYYGLVLYKLGHDLQTLRSACRHKRYTPRMTLGVAIQLVSISFVQTVILLVC